MKGKCIRAIQYCRYLQWENFTVLIVYCRSIPVLAKYGHFQQLFKGVPVISISYVKSYTQSLNKIVIFLKSLYLWLFYFIINTKNLLAKSIEY